MPVKKQDNQSEVEKYKSIVKKQLSLFVDVLRNVALGDYSKKVKVPDKEDEFTELQVAINLMIEDLKELQAENVYQTGALEEAKKELEKKVEVRTKEINETQEKLEALFNTSFDAIMVLDPAAGKFVSANPATIKLFGAKNEKEFIALSPADVSSQKQPNGKLSTEESKKMITKALNEGSNLFEWTHQKTNGETFFASVLLSKMNVGGKNLLQATVRDISNIKANEAKIKERQEELEKLNKFMVGRELKMLELKARIKQLEESKK